MTKVKGNRLKTRASGKRHFRFRDGTRIDFYTPVFLVLGALRQPRHACPPWCTHLAHSTATAARLIAECTQMCLPRCVDVIAMGHLHYECCLLNEPAQLEATLPAWVPECLVVLPISCKQKGCSGTWHASVRLRGPELQCAGRQVWLGAERAPKPLKCPMCAGIMYTAMPRAELVGTARFVDQKNRLCCEVVFGKVPGAENPLLQRTDSCQAELFTFASAPEPKEPQVCASCSD